MLTIIIPSYNGEKCVGVVIDNVKKYVRQPYELFVVDDCSSDRTSEVAKRHGAKVIRHKQNFGGVAPEDYKNFKGDKIIALDDDMEHHPKDIPKLVKALDNCDIVIAARTWRSRLVERILDNICNFPCDDVWSGFIGFRRKWIDLVQKHRLRLWLETHLAIPAAGGRICNVQATTSKGLRPSRFGGQFRGTIKTILFLRRYQKHAALIGKNSCHKTKSSSAPSTG